jgi:hypothetical protein
LSFFYEYCIHFTRALAKQRLSDRVEPVKIRLMKIQFPLTGILLICSFLTGVIATVQVDGAFAAAQPQRVSPLAAKEQQAARVKRFLQRIIDDLNLSRQLAEEDIADLEKRLDDIPPDNSMQIEADLLSLLDTHYSYLDWVKDRIEEFEGDMEQVSAENLPSSEFLENSMVDMVSMLNELEKVLQDKVDRFSAEEKHPGDSISREKALQPKEPGLDTKGEKTSTGESVEPSKNEKSATGSESPLPSQAEAERCTHNRIMAERGKGEADWIRLQIDEYTMLARVARLLPRDTSRFRQEINYAVQMTIKAYKEEISLLDKKINQLDKERSAFTPADASHEEDHPCELADLYVKLQIRYNDLINRLRTGIGSWEAESVEIGPDR